MEMIDKATLYRNLLFRSRKEEISINRLRLGVGVLSLKYTFVYLLKKDLDYPFAVHSVLFSFSAICTVLELHKSSCWFKLQWGHFYFSYKGQPYSGKRGQFRLVYGGNLNWIFQMSSRPNLDVFFYQAIKI